MNPTAHEVNLDSLVAPFHNFAGLSRGNVASEAHRGAVSNPKAAALQGLEKMKLLADLGVKQAVLPPQERPDLRLLRRVGFRGRDAQILDEAYKTEPRLLAMCYSASSMWTANAATVCPSADATDHRVHFTPANLASQVHRSLEAPKTAELLKAVFPRGPYFVHHAPLPVTSYWGDEGAANHMRLCADHGAPGVQVFVYGRAAAVVSGAGPRIYRARQTLEASRAVARLHRTDPKATLFIRQNPCAIDAGAFHNDVAAVSHRNLLLYHAEAFEDGDASVRKIEHLLARRNVELQAIRVTSEELSLTEAVQSYLFNSQLATLPDETTALIAPVECREMPRARQVVENILEGPNPITSVHYVDLRESMKNGGGPACTRLRVALTPDELAYAHAAVFFTDDLYTRLRHCIEHHYRDRLTLNDLADPSFLEEVRCAMEKLSRVLDLPL
ncbi:MAG: N-succinylarginine dihydrolase [Candidatus Hydrogenedentes bacterium]|nr:N-succinylarginine dihydrolase [Candidatus Hydrogenedentota bacterium]